MSDHSRKTWGALLWDDSLAKHAYPTGSIDIVYMVIATYQTGMAIRDKTKPNYHVKIQFWSLTRCPWRDGVIYT